MLTLLRVCLETIALKEETRDAQSEFHVHSDCGKSVYCKDTRLFEALPPLKINNDLCHLNRAHVCVW